MGSNVPVARVQEALGQLVGAAREGLLALSVGVGLGVMSELLEEEVDEVVGPRGKRDFDRSAVRHGRESGEVTLGGRRVQVERPRVRAADGSREVRDTASINHRPVLVGSASLKMGGCEKAAEGGGHGGS